jgi:hypothetical protein
MARRFSGSRRRWARYTAKSWRFRSAGKAQFYALLTRSQKAKAAAFEQKAGEVPGGEGE